MRRYCTMSALAEISVQPTEDPNMKAYHTRFEMSSGPEEGTRGNSPDLGEFGNLILSTRGVIQVRVCPYILLVTKAPLFEWKEIDPEIEQILKHFAFSQRQLSEANVEQVKQLPRIKEHGRP